MAELIAWCLCAWLGAGTPKHGRSEFCHRGVWAGPPAPYPAALQLPDPARDARIERRRAADRAAASRALDRFISELYGEVVRRRWGGVDPMIYPSPLDYVE